MLASVPILKPILKEKEKYLTTPDIIPEVVERIPKTFGKYAPFYTRTMISHGDLVTLDKDGYVRTVRHIDETIVGVCHWERVNEKCWDIRLVAYDYNNEHYDFDNSWEIRIV